MTKATTGERLYRYNLLLADEESAWLDQLAEQIREESGAKVSRSEIVRSALAGLRELHTRAPECLSRFPPLTSCKSGADLSCLAVLAVHWATNRQE